MSLFPDGFLDSIQVGDSRKLLTQMPSESVNIVITSPPYNLGSRYANTTPDSIQGKWSRVIQYSNYQDDMPDNEYMAWQHETLRECWRIIRPDGAIFYNHRPRIQDGQVWTRFDLIPDGLKLRQLIVWKRPKGHNFNKGYYVPSFEWIFLLAKDGFELADSGPGDVWEFQPATSKESNGHPAPFPVDLPLLAIRSAAKADVVLDPFMGSGTTAVAAKTMGKHFIGFEIDPKSAELARVRINNVVPLLIEPAAEQIGLF
jgi:modification methylase